MKSITVAVLISILPFQLTAQGSFGSLKPKMIKVEGGTLKRPSREESRNKERYEQISVESFQISQYEITVRQYKAFCDETGHKMPKAPGWGWQDDHPIIKVSYYDAMAYCKWLNVKYGGNWTLPTEAEWDFAVRGGNKRKGFLFPGSNNCDEVAWYENNSGGKTNRVGQKKPNELGIYDMHGNVSEFCYDFIERQASSDESKQPPLQSLPPGNSKCRGNSWKDKCCDFETLSYAIATMGYSDSTIGFRVSISNEKREYIEEPPEVIAPTIITLDGLPDKSNYEMKNEISYLKFSLKFFSFDKNTDTVSEEEAKRILSTIGVQEIFRSQNQSEVFFYGNLDTLSVTIWVGTYGRKDRYGIRYGPKDLSYQRFNDSYFEVLRR